MHGVVQFAHTAEDMRHALKALLGLLAAQTDGRLAARLVGGPLLPAVMSPLDMLPAVMAKLDTLASGMARLDATAEDRRKAREALLGLLADVTDARLAVSLAGGVTRLGATAEDRRKAREALLGLLADETDAGLAEHLASGIAGLDPTAEDRRQAREALLGLAIVGQTPPKVAVELLRTVCRLDPTVRDPWPNRTIPLLFAEVRRNSALADWLAALQSSTL